MKELTPQEAAAVAQNVYDVLPVVKDMSQVDLGIKGLFVVENTSRFEGRSGCLFFNSHTGLGYLARGDGERRNEALIAIRGTARFPDWITDFDAGIDIGPSGLPVHSGFSKTFKSFQVSLENELSRIGPSAVHVVGHSLGGALATLTADYLTRRKIPVKLYTFGCPRTGTIPHANHLTQSLGEHNIYRVYHSADPVPMLPTFPFLHVPATNNAYFLGWPGVISFYSHKMDRYRGSIGTADGWRGLRGLAPAISWREQADDWVESLKLPGSVTMLSAASLWLISHTLEAIIRSISTTISIGWTCGMTLLDRLAQLLYSGVLVSVKIAEQVKELLLATMKFLGRTIDASTQVSIAFISWVLRMLFRVLATMALKAVEAAHSRF